MNPPLCPKGHGPMMLVTITQGERDEEIYLGRYWACVNNDRDRSDFCDECEDCEDDIEPGSKLRSVTVQQKKAIEQGQIELFEKMDNGSMGEFDWRS